MFQINVYIPVEYKDQVKEAMFIAGAGKIGNYDCCSFEYEGMGQFRPLKGSKPFLGETLQIEEVKEIKVEMVCTDEVIEAVIQAMKASHPYETPAYHVIELLNF
jgi:hypothetical protein